MNCKICEGKTEYFGNALVLKKYHANYRLCKNCGFIFTENPFWLSESYENAIAKTDIGLVSRAEITSLHTKSIIELCFNESGMFLDYGAGYGLFVRRMRDIGYNFRAYDRYCENIFSSGFQIESLNNTNFDLITAFEVVEHIQNQIECFDELFNHSKSLLFTTELVTSPLPQLTEWWYYGLDHGQHISFHTIKSLKYLADRFNKRLYSNGMNLHLITSQRINKTAFRLSSNLSFCRLLHIIRNRSSLLQADWQYLLDNNV